MQVDLYIYGYILLVVLCHLIAFELNDTNCIKEVKNMLCPIRGMMLKHSICYWAVGFQCGSQNGTV